MTTDFEQFQASFLGQCKAAGLDARATEQIVDELLLQLKSADSWLANVPGVAPIEHLASSIADKLPDVATATYFGLPLATGFAGGVGLAKLRDLGDEDPAEVRTRESIDAYRNLARQMSIKEKLRLLNRPTRARSPLVR